jgi:hypothetical protein
VPGPRPGLPHRLSSLSIALLVAGITTGATSGARSLDYLLLPAVPELWLPSGLRLSVSDFVCLAILPLTTLRLGYATMALALHAGLLLVRPLPTLFPSRRSHLFFVPVSDVPQ